MKNTLVDLSHNLSLIIFRKMLLSAPIEGEDENVIIDVSDDFSARCADELAQKFAAFNGVKYHQKRDALSTVSTLSLLESDGLEEDIILKEAIAYLSGELEVKSAVLTQRLSFINDIEVTDTASSQISILPEGIMVVFDSHLSDLLISSSSRRAIIISAKEVLLDLFLEFSDEISGILIKNGILPDLTEGYLFQRSPSNTEDSVIKINERIAVEMDGANTPPELNNPGDIDRAPSVENTLSEQTVTAEKAVDVVPPDSSDKPEAKEPLLAVEMITDSGLSEDVLAAFRRQSKNSNAWAPRNNVENTTGSVIKELDVAPAQDSSLSAEGLRSFVMAHTDDKKDISEDDGLLIDVVGHLFESVMADLRVTAKITSLIGRLQIPVLKLTLLNRNIGSVESPSRQYIDLAADIGMKMSDEGVAETDVYAEVLDCVLQAQTVAIKDLDALFLESTSRLNKVNQLDTKDAKKTERKIVKKSESSDKKANAETAAQDDIAEAISGLAVSGFIESFLNGYWFSALRAAYLQKNQSKVNEIKIITGLLLLCIKPMTPIEAKEASTSFNAGIKRAKKILMDDLFLDESEVKSILKTFFYAFKENFMPDGMAGEKPESPEPAKLEKWTKDDGSLLVEVDSQGDSLSSKDTELKASTKALVEELKIDAIVMKKDIDGEVIRGRLAWISETNQRYVFVDRKGASIFETSRNGLIIGLNNNTLEITQKTESSLFKRAFSSIKL